MKKTFAVGIFLTFALIGLVTPAVIAYAQSNIVIAQESDPAALDTPPEDATAVSADQAALDKATEKSAGASTTLKANTKSLFTSGGYKVDSASANLPARVGRVIYIIFAISGTIFLGMVIYSGIRWMTAGGDSDQVKKSRQRIVRASIGLLILLMSYLLTNFVLRGLLFGAQSSGGNFQFTAPPGAEPLQSGSAQFYR